MFILRNMVDLLIPTIRGQNTCTISYVSVQGQFANSKTEPGILYNKLCIRFASKVANLIKTLIKIFGN